MGNFALLHGLLGSGLSCQQAKGERTPRFWILGSIFDPPRGVNYAGPVSSVSK